MNVKNDEVVFYWLFEDIEDNICMDEDFQAYRC